MAQYSDKVMEHFMNPRNVGEIPDADGVGTVGNPVCGDLMTFYIKIAEDGKTIKDVKYKTFGCLPYGEKVLDREFQLINIEQIKKLDKVLDSEVKETFVVETYKSNYNGDLLKIIPFVSPYNSFVVTPNHPVLCVKRSLVKGNRFYNKKSVFRRIDVNKLLSTQAQFMPARELEVGDYIVFPRFNKVEDSEIFTIDIMRLLGYYLAEGYIVADNSCVCFSFNKNEKEIIDEVKSLIKKITKKEAKQRIRNNVVEVYVCSRKLARFLIEHCGKYANYKKLSSKVLELPKEKLFELIKTYHIGDGDVYKRREHNSETYRIITTSEVLAVQIQQVLSKCGIFASIREIYKTDCYIGARKLKDSRQFLITYKLNRKHKFVHMTDNYFLVPIKKIERISYSGEVFNFQVAFSPNTYLVKGFAVHNCGAAIAVSSMVSEMAKGKTIDEVLKFTREMVAEELGGLPPQKMHCSNLGVDALHKAIEDYLSKKKLHPVLCKCPFCDGELPCAEIMECKKCEKQIVKCPSCGKLVSYEEVCSNCGEKLR